MDNDADPELTWARDLSETLDVHFAGGAILPGHVFNRIATLVGEEGLVYADSSLSGNEPGHTTGRIVVWTEHHVLIAKLTYVSLVDPYGPARDQPVDGKVSVQVLPRKSLLGISVPAELRANYGWQQTASHWPRDAKVTLTYEGLDEPITVPTDEPRPNFLELVRALVRDQLG